MEKELNKIIEKYDRIYTGLEDEDYSELEKFLDKKINSPLFAKINCKKLLKHMNVIFKYTNLTNKKIFLNKTFVNQKGFVKAFINNMKYYPHKDGLISLATEVFLPGDKLFTQDFIDEFIRINPDYYYDLYFYLSGVNKTYLLGECLRHGVDISKNVLSIDDMDKSLICYNINEFASVADYLFNLKLFVSGDKKASTSLREYMEEHPIQCINSILIYKFKKSDLDKFNELIYLIVKDICANEAISIADIDFLFEGACSIVFKIGNKVLKISVEKFTEKISNNPYIIKPLIRKKIEIEDKKMFIEVQELVDTAKNATKDELSDLYIKLRKIGLIWNDPSSYNVGRLKKDNELYWRFPIEPSNEILNFSDNRGTGTLKKGDLVIIDNDSIYSEDNPPKKMTHSLYFERLYLIELQSLLHELKNEKNSKSFEEKCIEHGFDPNYIHGIIDDEKKYTLTMGKMI